MKTDKDFISTYGLNYDYSFRNEQFYSISIYWRAQFSILKIRIANWRPKHDRSNQAVFYYDVNTKDEARKILESFKEFDFKAIEKEFERMHERDNAHLKNTGETSEWSDGVIKTLRNKFNKP